MEQQGLFLKDTLGFGVGKVVESESGEPSVRERNEGAATRGAAVEGGGGRQPQGGAGPTSQVTAAPPSSPSCRRGRPCLLPVKGCGSDWGEGTPCEGAELFLLEAA